MPRQAQDDDSIPSLYELISTNAEQNDKWYAYYA